MIDWTFVSTAEELEGLNQLRDHHHLPRIEKIALASEWGRACAEIDACAEASDKGSIPVGEEQEAAPVGLTTPGPWLSAGVHVEDAHHHRCVADCQPQHEGRLGAVEALHNACLIAAAPDLYAACKALEWSFNFLDIPEKYKRQAEALRAAVAKAEGRQA